MLTTVKSHWPAMSMISGGKSKHNLQIFFVILCITGLQFNSVPQTVQFLDVMHQYKETNQKAANYEESIKSIKEHFKGIEFEQFIEFAGENADDYYREMLGENGYEVTLREMKIKLEQWKTNKY
jgi:hypothetical protein